LVAKKVASGDVDPVTLLPMEDINSSFVPRVPLKTNILNYSNQDKGKEKAKMPGKSGSEGILHFFGAYPHPYIRV
jgi:exonuclease-1